MDLFYKSYVETDLASLHYVTVAMDLFCKSYAEGDFASLYYVTFIESLAVFFQQRPCPSTRKSLQNNSNNKLIEEKINDSFLILEEHFFAIILVQKNL
jgi:hypothetical protein